MAKAAGERRARQGDEIRPRCSRCRSKLIAGRSTPTITYYYCRSDGCKKLPGVKRPRPFWSPFGLTLEQERRALLDRVAIIDKMLAKHAGQEEKTRGSGGACARPER